MGIRKRRNLVCYEEILQTITNKTKSRTNQENYVKEPSQPKSLSFLCEVLGYDLYYSLTHPFK